MRDWEKLARACRRYLDAYNDEIADDVTLASVGNDLRIIAIREVQPAPRVFFPGDTVPADVWTVDRFNDVVEPSDDPWTWHGFNPLVELVVPSPEQWQSTVDRARAEREAKHDG